MQEILLVILLIVSLALVGVILLQQGKGAGLGASFGAGASGTVFGAPGSATILTKITTVLAIVFFGIALALASMSPGTTGISEGDLFDKASEEAAVNTPASEEIPTEVLTAPESDIPTEEKAPEATPEVKADSTEEKSAEEETSTEEKKEEPVNS